MTKLLTAAEVQELLRVKSRAVAIRLMARLPHIDLAPAGAARRVLRVTSDTLEAYMNGRIKLDETNVYPMPVQRPKIKPQRGGKKRIPEIIPFRR